MNNQIVYTIKNLTIIDLDKLIKLSLSQAQNFCTYHNLNFQAYKGDGYKLTLHYFFFNFFSIYKNKTTKNILCYSNNTKIENAEYHHVRNIDNKIIKLIISKTFDFPTLLSNIPIDEYIKTISDDSPEYDEAINNNFSLIDNFNKIKQYIKNSKLIALDKKYDRISEELSLLLNI